MRYIITLYTATVDDRLGQKTYTQWGRLYADAWQIRPKEIEQANKIKDQETVKFTIAAMVNKFNDTTGKLVVDLGTGPRDYAITSIAHGCHWSEIIAVYKK